MKRFLKENKKILFFVLVSGLIGGYCIGLWAYDSLSQEVLVQLQEQNINKEMIALSTSFQYSVFFGVILAMIGIVLSKKVSLWRKFAFHQKAFITTMTVSIIGALMLFPGDKLIFGSLNSWVNDQYNIAPSFAKIVGGLLVGGVIEEVMLRLFLMSLFVFILSKLFYKNKKEIPVEAYVIGNILSSFFFAIGHLPSTMMMTTLTPIIIIRCFLLNGGIGLCLGYLYRKYNIGYAMIAHGLTHLISDILMLIFI